jgi:hypothetical protein
MCSHDFSFVGHGETQPQVERRARLTMLAIAALLASGCVIESSTCDECDCAWGEGGTAGFAGTGGTGGSGGGDVVRAAIDTGAKLQTVAGDGVGAFIEYEQGGRWHVFTTCDTRLSGLPCYFNVIATLPEGASYGGLSEESLESEDGIYEYADGVELATVTREDVDGMYFDAPAGEVVRFEVYLDDGLDARFIYWVGGGAVHNGAPTNPIDLLPSAP